MTEPGVRRSRRRVTVLAAVALAGLLVAGVVAAVRLQPTRFALVPRAEIGMDGAVLERPDPAPDAVDPAGDGKAVCALVSIAVAGPLTTARAPTGTGVRDGVRLAVDDHNDANPGCQVQLKELDTDGADPMPPGAGLQIVDDVYTIGMIGPASSEISDELRDALARSGLVTVAASAGTHTAPAGGRAAFFRGIAGLTAQGSAVARYLTGPANYRRVCVADDGTPHGSGLAQAVTTALNPSLVSCDGPQTLRDNDIDAIAESIGTAAPDAVYFGGSAAQAGELLQRLRERGVGAALLSAAEADGEALFGYVGEDPDGVSVALPYGPDPGWFSDDFAAKFDSAPGDLTAVGYDLATIMLRGIDAGMLTRPQMAEWIRGYDGQGVAHRYRWAADGELTEPTVWLYDVEKR
ncbi:branched-chain amino acid ABC transporter substrate-binding protein [Mycolicibacterium arseniciresistens]|uniref:Branched-chain amino acid ABC transporter substrate-binding protein n=1 Tax=Mycolicibacterium arseniciresistens TaxID=3062257 RepID=A0ABT8ULX3_9MYCO|nr:branched-chain amino acid ABC transporter substrate-binding protein [Mycolicibacterium arseniciresistens]MDO3637378.1 branched-chain amino acid ABC transporter substrate-binding protein [Mycolicibacterium arseniciresistens]